MLRITSLSRTPQEEVLKVEGWVTAENVPLLTRAGEAALQRGARLVLELGGMQSIDEEGVALLKRWSGKQLALRGGTWFVQILLAEHGLHCQDREEPG